MAKFVVEEIKEIITKAEIEAVDAEQALLLYKRSRSRDFVLTTSEERHIIVNKKEG